MNVSKKVMLAGLVFSGLVIGLTGEFGETASAAEPIAMHRLYNRNSGEHFYTADSREKDGLVLAGWQYENIGWYAPDSGEAVYRLYNRNAGDHHYTTKVTERDYLVSVGWEYENIGWYSGGTVPLYRSYNRNAVAGSHNYTANKAEHDGLINKGWTDEKIGWYGVDLNAGDQTAAQAADNKKFDALSAELQILLITSIEDWRTEVPELQGLGLGYNYDAGNLYTQISSGAGSGHPVFEFRVEATQVVSVRAYTYAGAATIESVDVAAAPTPKWVLYRKYAADSAHYDACLSKVKQNTLLTKQAFDERFALIN